MLTELQKRTIQAIVNTFETGTPGGDYSRVTLLSGDSGHLTYGRSQTTLASGSLARLVRSYCATRDGSIADELRQYLPRLEACDTSLDTDTRLGSLLHDAGADPVMRRIQDEFFDRAYWDPALRAAESLGIETALGTAVIYDSFIHGAWARMRDATLARTGLPSAALAKEGLPSASQNVTAGIGEREWIRQYIHVRREWLATHPNPLLRRTVYRMKAFTALANEGNWDLALPLGVHGVLLDERAVAGEGAAPLAAPSLAAAQEAHSEKDA